MMKVGDLVTWDEGSNACPPWFYDNWKDIGIVVEIFDIDTVIVKWNSGEKFPVWKVELKILSETNISLN
jgi:hypothetical protein